MRIAVTAIDAGEPAPEKRVAKGVEVPVEDEFPHRRLPPGDRYREHQREDRDDLKQRLGDVVVGEPDEAALEELSREEQEDDGTEEAGDAPGEALADGVHRDGDERAEHRGRDEQRL